jgi:hypothetical protein
VLSFTNGGADLQTSYDLKREPVHSGEATHDCSRAPWIRRANPPRRPPARSSGRTQGPRPDVHTDGPRPRAAVELTDLQTPKHISAVTFMVPSPVQSEDITGVPRRPVVNQRSFTSLCSSRPNANGQLPIAFNAEVLVVSGLPLRHPCWSWWARFWSSARNTARRAPQSRGFCPRGADSARSRDEAKRADQRGAAMIKAFEGHEPVEERRGCLPQPQTVRVLAKWPARKSATRAPSRCTGRR